MKRQFGTLAARLTMLVPLLLASVSFAADKKPFKDVDSTSLTTETQKVLADQNQMNLVWVIPSEFWDVALTQDGTVPEFQRDEMLRELKNYMIIGVIRADLSPFGSFNFHDEKSVYDTLQVTYIDANGKRLTLKPQRRVDNDAQVLIDTMKPVLRQAMGKMGDNFHMFVCENTVGPARTVISPYEFGVIAVTLDPLGNNIGGTAEISFPLDSLHIPRKCVNCTKAAHISWQYCPWCGEKHAP